MYLRWIASFVNYILVAIFLWCNVSSLHCIFGVMYMHFWYAMHRQLCWCLVGVITIVQCIFGALFLGLGCNIFLVLRLWCYALSAISRRLATAVAHLLYKYKYSWWIIFAVSLFKNLLVKIWWVEPLTRTLYYILQLQQPWRLSQEVLNGCAVEPCPAKQWQTVNSESISRVVQPPPLSSSQVFVYSQPPIECLALCLSG